MPTVHSHGVDIYYEVYGAGAPVIFAHGMGGNTVVWWQQVQHFAQRYRVIVYDQRYFGRSTREGDIFFPEHFADDARAVLDAENADRAAVVCQSMGGWSGVQLTHTSPERVQCLILCGTPGGIMTDGAIAGLQRTRERLEGGATILEMALAPDFPDQEPAKSYLYEQISGLNPPRENDKMLRLVTCGIQPDALHDWNTPTRFLSGEHDAFWSPEQLRTVHAVIPGSEFIEIPGSGHSPYFEMPEVFNRYVDEFFAQHYPA